MAPIKIVPTTPLKKPSRPLGLLKKPDIPVALIKKPDIPVVLIKKPDIPVVLIKKPEQPMIFVKKGKPINPFVSSPVNKVSPINLTKEALRGPIDRKSPVFELFKKVEQSLPKI